MKQVGKLNLCLLIGLTLLCSFSSCDGETEPNMYASYFYINDTSDSLFVNFHYSYKDHRYELQQGYRSYSLGYRDTISFLYGEYPDDMARADTISIKNSIGEYLFYPANYGSFWNEKYYEVYSGEYVNRYYFIDDSILARCDTMLKN